MHHQETNTEIGSCPACQSHGIVKFTMPVLRNKVFKYELQVDDCPICEAYGLVEIIDDKNHDDRGTDNNEGDFHSGECPLF